MFVHPEVLRAAGERQGSRISARAGPAARVSPRPPRERDDLTAIALRLCRVGDDDALARLAALEERAVPRGQFVVAEVDGRIVAALPLDGGAPLRDPFVRTAHLLRLLELRAAQITCRERDAAEPLAVGVRAAPQLDCTPDAGQAARPVCGTARLFRCRWPRSGRPVRRASAPITTFACAEQHLAGRGEHQRARAARAVDQALPDERLERRDLMADRRLDVAEPLGRPPERSLTRHRIESHQMTQLDADPPIPRHTSCDERLRGRTVRSRPNVRLTRSVVRRSSATTKTA